MANSNGVRYCSGNGAQFSSKKCPPGPGLESCCELPFGFVWTPVAPVDTENMSVVDCNGEALPPLFCLSCLTYLNLHAKLHPARDVWECPLCGSDENVLDPKLIGTGGALSSALSTPVVEYRQKVHIPPGEGKKPTCSYILVLDSNLSREEANAVGMTIQTICTPKDDDDTEIKIGLIVFDKSVAMYQLGLSSGIASADFCTIRQANSDEHLANRRLQIQKRPYLTAIRPGRTDDFSSMWRCISAIYGTTLSGDYVTVEASGAAPPRPSRLDQLKQRKEAREREQAVKNATTVPQESPWVKARRKAAAAHPSRCTGEALQCALDLATIGQAKSPSGRAHILLFTNGCPNIGDGSVVVTDNPKSKPKRSLSSTALHKPDVIEEERLTTAVQYFEKLAETGQDHEVGIDVFCTGASKGFYAFCSLISYVVQQNSTAFFFKIYFRRY